MSALPSHRPRPIFIVGTMGSGTTLLRLMLDSHPGIAIARETGFARSISSIKAVPFRPHGSDRWARRLGFTDEELDDRVREFYEGMFRRFAEQRNKPRWGDKTPFHLWHIDTLRHYWPDAQIIACVRNPGAVVSSNAKRFDWSFDKGAANWRKQNLVIAQKAVELGDDMVLCRYEDLVQRSEPVMRELLDWLGEKWSDDVLNHHEVQAAAGKKRVEGSTQANEAIDPARMTKWASAMPAAGHKAVATTRAMAEFMGYSLDDPAALAPWSDADEPILLGSKVAARQQRFPAVKWSSTPVRNFADDPLTHDRLRAFMREQRREERRRIMLERSKSVSVAARVRRKVRRLMPGSG